MATTVKRFSLWSSWNHEGEEDWLNEMSERGLHLEKAYPFWATFGTDSSVRYVYRLDYQSDIRGGAKFQEYVNLYGDAGWEYVCTFAGNWHYFRQPYKAGEVQELYTDRVSLKAHYQRIRRILAGAGIMSVPLILLNVRNLQNMRQWDGDRLSGSVAVMVGFQLAVAFLLVYGFIQMSRKIRNLSKGE